tara:strand:- start:84 stop:1172 length:1089 start_codon:yes stop_codon:yes gene_type:complete
MVNQKHFKFFLRAHNLAKKKFGSTFPNPVVGCVIVNNNKIISSGVTASEGRPHAEEIALKKAGKKAKGATMYVTLEPCFHKSRNGSCTEQILRSGIKSVFISRHDPDIRTNRRSINKLKKNDIYVNLGLTSDKTNNINKFFFLSLKNQRPFTKVKMAISSDEKIAWSNYHSKWISNSLSRNYAHKIRLHSQAILTTAKTIIKDNPRFTVRKNNKVIKYLPTIIIDNSLKIPLKSKLFNDISKKRIIIFTSKKNSTKIKFLKKIGCEVFLLKKQKNNMLNLKTIFNKLYKLKINDILVEAGGIFFTNLLKLKLVDEIHLFKSSINIGNNGKPLIIGKKIEDLKYKEVSKKKFGNDIYHYFKIN